MKILHCITGLNTGGAETMLCKLVSRLCARGVANRVVSLLEPGPLAVDLESLGVRVDSLGMTRGLPSPGALVKMARIIREWRPDVVQTWLYHADLLGLLAAKLGGSPPVVWNLRCSYMDLSQYSTMTALVLRACSWLSPLPDAVLTNSAQAKRFHTDMGYRPRRFEVIPNGFDTDRFKPDVEARAAVRRELGLSEAVPLVGLVARYDPMKDHATFVAAAAGLIEKRPDAHFLLCGDGVDHSNEPLVRLIRESGLEQAVHLLGRRHDIPALTAALDCAVCSSIGESFPNVIGEAMACAVPCVVTDVGDAARIVEGTGLVVPVRDPRAMAEALERVLRDKETRRLMGVQARQRIVDMYSLEHIASRYHDFYVGLAGGGG